MGITALLKLLKSVSVSKNISVYANMTVAVDTYCWAVCNCAQDLCEGRETDEYIQYCLKRVDQLLQHKIKVVMVFDGGPLPRKRTENLQKAREYASKGEKEKAYQKYSEAVDVTPDMAHRVIQVLQSRGIECIVAPYEADAQLAYLSITKYVDVIITEDSDLLAFGALKVFFKMDKNGYGDEIEYSNIVNCSEMNLQGLTHFQFLTLCILSGCDYLDSIPGVGLKTAYIAVTKTTNYKQAIDYFARQQKFKVPLGYSENFEQAMLTFQFQRVFCPVQRKIVTLHDLDEPFEIQTPKDMPFIGLYHPDILGQNIADGLVDPITFKPFQKKPVYGVNHNQVQQFKLVIKQSQQSKKEESSKKQKPLESFFQQNPMKPFKTPSNISINANKPIMTLKLKKDQGVQLQDHESQIINIPEQSQHIQVQEQSSKNDSDLSQKEQVQTQKIALNETDEVVDDQVLPSLQFLESMRYAPKEKQFLDIFQSQPMEEEIKNSVQDTKVVGQSVLEKSQKYFEIFLSHQNSVQKDDSYSISQDTDLMSKHYYYDFGYYLQSQIQFDMM